MKEWVGVHPVYAGDKAVFGKKLVMFNIRLGDNKTIGEISVARNRNPAHAVSYGYNLKHPARYVLGRDGCVHKGITPLTVERAHGRDYPVNPVKRKGFIDICGD
jgi:hypothetical protein